ncbi:MAG: hypothetical protein R3B68_02410 [Phycisphaerales bacterium]
MSGEGSREATRDSLMASLACLVLAAMLGGVAYWLAHGVIAAERDFQRFDGHVRARTDIAAYAVYLIPLAGLSALGCLGLIGLAVWIPLAGRRRKRRVSRGRR